MNGFDERNGIGVLRKFVNACSHRCITFGVTAGPDGPHLSDIDDTSSLIVERDTPDDSLGVVAHRQFQIAFEAATERQTNLGIPFQEEHLLKTPAHGS